LATVDSKQRLFPVHVAASWEASLGAIFYLLQQRPDAFFTLGILLLLRLLLWVLFLLLCLMSLQTGPLPMARLRPAGVMTVSDKMLRQLRRKPRLYSNFSFGRPDQRAQQKSNDEIGIACCSRFVEAVNTVLLLVDSVDVGQPLWAIRTPRFLFSNA
jgi:hypothetical protein